jgi:hypothetical protein
MDFTHTLGKNYFSVFIIATAIPGTLNAVKVFVKHPLAVLLFVRKKELS